MLKYKYELIVVIVLIPILAYVGWQVYNSYIKTPDVEELEKAAEKERAESEIKIEEPSLQPPAPSTPKGNLDYAGFTERDPLKFSLPVKEKIEKPKEEEKPEEKEKPEKLPEKKEPLKEIVLPTFKVNGIVWGHFPRAIIDNQVYKTGDIVKGAKILNITNTGIQMIFEGKEFFVKSQGG